MKLPESQFAVVHKIRQFYAQALDAHESNPTPETAEVLQDISDKRARAIRMLKRDHNASIRELASMFRCNRGVIRKAIEDE